MKKISSRQLMALLISGALISTLTACSGGNGSGPSFAAATNTENGGPDGMNNDDPGDGGNDKGGGNGNNNGGTTPDTTSTTPTTSTGYQIGGVINNLLTEQSIKLVNGTETLSITNTSAANTSTFSFASRTPKDATYEVTVDTQPVWRWCDIANGKGIATADVTNINISCADARAKVETVGTAIPNDVPHNIAVNSKGEIFVISGNYDIARYSKDGIVFPAFSTTAIFGPNYQIGGVIVDSKDNLYLGIKGSNSKIAKLTPDSSPLGYSVDPSWAINPAAGNAYFSDPVQIAIDAQDNIYVLNGQSNSISPPGANRIVKIPPSGTSGTIVSYGHSQLNDSPIVPTSIAVDRKGAVFVADNSNATNVYQVFPELDHKPPQAIQITPALISLSAPKGIAFDKAGNLFVADSAVIHMLKPTGTSGTFAPLANFAGSTTGITSGIGTAAQFTQPTALTTDANSNVFVLENSTSPVRKITPVK